MPSSLIGQKFAWSGLTSKLSHTKALIVVILMILIIKPLIQGQIMGSSSRGPQTSLSQATLTGSDGGSRGVPSLVLLTT